MKKLAVAVAFGMLFCWAPAGAQPTGSREAVTPAELVARREALTNKPVVVEGVLVNRGLNYFTDLRIVLTDAAGGSGAEVLVRPWLPSALPPRPAGTTTPPPPTLSDYLGKKVEISGTLVDDDVRNVGRTKVLRVDSARIVN